LRLLPKIVITNGTIRENKIKKHHDKMSNSNVISQSKIILLSEN